MWSEEKARRKLNRSDDGGNMKSFCTKWRNDNSTQLYLELGDPADDLKFLHGIYIAPSTSIVTVPHLQKVFQADAAHINWGKNTLFSLYGTMANGKMSPVVLAVVFGNENNASWSKFWKFAIDVHPSINSTEVTIITNQCKGSVSAICEFAPNAFNFHCSYHRLQNIALRCKGGRGKHSPQYVFKELLGCNNVWDLAGVRYKYNLSLSNTAKEYMYKLHDKVQFPSARCDMGPNIFLYDHEASSGVESMNNANKAVHNYAAVDPVNSIILLLSLESKRYKTKQAAAWKWETLLTPKGEEICHKAFEVVLCNNYTFEITETEEHHLTTVMRKTVQAEGGRIYTVKTLKVAVNGSMFGSCTCGVTQTKTFPCRHMVALVQSGKIPGLLTQLSIMPTWCSTSTWQAQYPEGTSMERVVDIHHLKANFEPSRSIRCCPKIAAPNKPGAKNHGKRKKGPIEKKKGKKKRVGIPMDLVDLSPVKDGEYNGVQEGEV